MFTSLINSPISPLTVNYMNTLKRPLNEPDYSLSCLGIALFSSRIKNYSGMGGHIRNLREVSSCLYDVKTMLTKRKELIEEAQNTPGISYQIVPLSGTSLDTIRTEMKELDCIEVNAIEAYVAQELQMSLFATFINKETNCAIIFAGTNNMALYHLCWGFLPLLFPVIFERKPVTSDEVQILKSLSHRTSNAFVSLMAKALAPFKKSLLKTELNMCFKGFRERKVRQAEANVNSLRSNLDSIMDQYKQSAERLEQAIIIYEGLKVVNADENNEQEREAIDYLADNPRLHNIQYSDGKLTFDVDTILTNFDIMKFRNAVRAKDIYDSYRLPEESPFATKANRKLFMDALFNEQNPLLGVRIRGNILLQINRCFMDAPRTDTFDTSNPALYNAVTNPHFRYHGCPGQNREQITQCLREADIVSAIECSIAATGSVNIAETDITFRPFVQEILSSTKKIIRRFEDNAELTPAEALLWLIKKQGETAA